MHEGIEINSDVFWTVVLGACTGIFAWLMNLIKSMTVKRLNDLEAMHNENEAEINKAKERLSKIEATYATREDMLKIVDSIRFEVVDTLDKGLKRVHERIDQVYRQDPDILRKEPRSE